MTLQNEELQLEVDRLQAQLRVKNQELIDCRLTVAEFTLLLPRLEEQVIIILQFAVKRLIFSNEDRLMNSKEQSSDIKNFGNRLTDRRKRSRPLVVLLPIQRDYHPL